MSDSGNAVPDLLDREIGELELSVRLHNALTKGNNMRTVRDVIAWTEVEIKRTPNLGKMSLEELKGRLAEYGLTLREETRFKGDTTLPLPFPTKWR